MGLLDYYDESLRKNAQAFRPGPAPEPSFSLSATAATMGKAVPAGLLEAVGSVRDLSAASDRQFRESPRGRIVAQEYERRTGVKPENQYQEPGGGTARKKADEFMPDPLTAHAAQQIVGGFTKSITKAAAAMAVAGPTGGAVIFGGLEADDTAQRLMDKGIDSATAWQVGGVVGTLSAVGARLPVSGAAMAATTAGKVGATAALGVAGGPVSFMAQEGLSREILQRAGHADEAKLHDPFNPIGLAASMFPLAIGAASLRGALRKPIKTDADVRAAVELTPAEQAKSDAFERSQANLAELQAEIAKTKDPANRAILQTELDKQTKAAATEVRATAADRAAVNPEAVDAARVAVLDETVARSLPDNPMAHAEMLRAADAVGAGERVDAFIPAPWEIPRTLADAAPPADMAGELRGMAQGAFWAQQGGRLLRDGIDQPGDGGSGGFVTGRTPWVPADEWFGRMRQQLGADGLSRQEDIAAAVEKAVSGQRLRAAEQRTVDWMRTEVDSLRMEAQRGGFDEFSANTLASEGFSAGLGRNDAADLTLTARAARIDEAAVERAAMQYENDDAAFLAEMQRIISDAEPAQQPAQVSVPGSGPRGTGDGAPQVRTPNAFPEADQVAVKATPADMAGMDAKTAQKLAEQRPDLPVRLPGDEKTTTLSAALERIREEQAQEAQMADLYQVAVTCFLTGGAAI